MALPLDTLFLWVTDLYRSVEWYSKIGIEAGPRFGDWQTMVVSGETRFALHQGDRPVGPPTAVPSFRVEDLGAAMVQLESEGVVPVDESTTDTGQAIFITYGDPDGNLIQLLERR